MDHFKLDKWYLDFVSEEGVALILYVAHLHWKGITIPYTACLSRDPEKGTHHRSGFRSVQMPELSEDRITWRDHRFRLEGEWQQESKPLSAVLFRSDEGSLHWMCHQPASKVELKLGSDLLKGTGYAEQLILTVLPWEIPMEELRWGRVYTDKGPLVWIEIRGDHPQQWVWFEGKRCTSCIIENDKLYCRELALELDLEEVAVLESGKTIGAVMDALTKYLPGFKSSAALSFLLADSYKWLSKACLKWQGTEMPGTAIHEWVNFNTT